MNRTKLISVVAGTSLGMAMLATVNVAQAFNMGNMMDPGEWFGGDDDDYYRYDRYRYGGGGPYGWGGPYGGGWGGPYGGGWGGPYGGWGGPYGGYGGQPSTIVVNPSSDAKQSAPPPRLPE
jgi:hypothetical protein